MSALRRPIPVLHVDIEGGWGGSSRSLYELVTRVDRARITPVVAFAHRGLAESWYRDAGISAYHIPEIGSYVPRETKAFKNLIASLPKLARLCGAAAKLEDLARKHEVGVIHLNYEGLFLLAGRLKKLGLPLITHSRAMVGDNLFGRWLARSLTADVERIFFISPQEQDRFLQLCPAALPIGEILWNISRAPAPRGSFGEPAEAVYFGSLDFSKGTDRLIDVALELRRVGAPPLRIAVYGRGRADAGFGRKMSQRIARENLHDRIVLKGYSDEPMAVMATALALIRPSRTNDPWGRDVIEAMSAGLPVIATGRYAGVVQHEKTGFLYDVFDASIVARQLVTLLNDRALWQRMSEASSRWATEKFSGAEQSERFMSAVEAICEKKIS